jgi:hypothetical protein
MPEHWRNRLAEHWRALVFVLVGVVVAAVGFIFGGPVAGATALFTVCAGILSRQPSNKSPKPRLELSVTRKIDLHPSRQIAAIFARASGEDPVEPELSGNDAGIVKFGGRRELDHQAICRDAVARAEASAPRDGVIESMLLGAMGQFARPTEEDREDFAQKVDAYGKEIKGWLERITAPVEAEMEVLAARVLLRNPAKLDATEARVVLRFSKAFTAAPNAEELEEPPTVPAFPLRRSGIGLMEPRFDFGPRYPVVPPISALSRTRFDVAQFSTEQPTYEERDEGFVVSYPRRTVRHGEIGTAGDDLRVRCTKAGAHEVAWEIHASNLEKAATGTHTVINNEEAGEPVQTLADLEHLLVELGLASEEED